jgi:hypothetical protein
MQGKSQVILQDRDKSGRYRPGFNPRISKRLRVEAKFLELIAEYFPNGGYSVMDANRLKLAAQHYFTAETARDAVVAQRATRVAEYLLSKLRPAALHPLAAQVPVETARELLDRLGKEP